MVWKRSVNSMELLEAIFEIFEIIGLSLTIGWGFRCGWRLFDFFYNKEE